MAEFNFDIDISGVSENFNPNSYKNYKTILRDFYDKICLDLESKKKFAKILNANNGNDNKIIEKLKEQIYFNFTLFKLQFQNSNLYYNCKKLNEMDYKIIIDDFEFRGLNSNIDECVKFNDFKNKKKPSIESLVFTIKFDDEYIIAYEELGNRKLNPPNTELVEMFKNYLTSESGTHKKKYKEFLSPENVNRILLAKIFKKRKENFYAAFKKYISEKKFNKNDFKYHISFGCSGHLDKLKDDFVIKNNFDVLKQICDLYNTNEYRRKNIEKINEMKFNEKERIVKLIEENKLGFNCLSHLENINLNDENVRNFFVEFYKFTKPISESGKILKPTKAIDQGISPSFKEEFDLIKNINKHTKLNIDDEEIKKIIEDKEIKEESKKLREIYEKYIQNVGFLLDCVGIKELAYKIKNGKITIPKIIKIKKKFESGNYSDFKEEIKNNKFFEIIEEEYGEEYVALRDKYVKALQETIEDFNFVLTEKYFNSKFTDNEIKEYFRNLLSCFHFEILLTEYNAKKQDEILKKSNKNKIYEELKNILDNQFQTKYKNFYKEELENITNTYKN